VFSQYFCKRAYETDENITSPGEYVCIFCVTVNRGFRPT